MKIQFILTIILLACGILAGVYFSEKKQKDGNENWDLKEKYTNNHDSIFLSDIIYTYKDKVVSNIDSLPKSELKNDTLFLVEIKVYDNVAWTIKLPKENIVFQAYQDENSYVDKFKKSAIHIYENPIAYRRAGRYWDRFMDIYNKDNLSSINRIRTYFYNGHLQKVIVMYKKANA